MQFPNLGSMHRRSRRPTETLPVLPCMCQASSGSLPEDFPFCTPAYPQYSSGATQALLFCDGE